MRLAIDGQGYASATEAFVRGNRFAAATARSVAGRLQGYAGMAGDDSTSAEFAACYDESARESVGALGDLVGVLASLGHLAEASLGNHQRAEERSVLPGWAAGVVGPPSLADQSVTVLLPLPPTSLGGDPPALPGPVDWLLDQLEGVVWPGADTERLRAAGAVWRDAAASVGLVNSYCDSALDGFDRELSAEVPLAVAATQDLRRTVEDLAAQLAAVGAACETYADQVDEKRAEMLALLEELAAELAAGAIIAGGLTLLSAGLAGPAAGAAGSARLAWAARELKMIVDALRLAAGGTAGTLRPVSTEVREARSGLARFLRAAEARADQRGVIRPGAFFERERWRPGWLAAHEHSGSHTLLEHVGKSDGQLLERFERVPHLRRSSTFTDETVAERAIEKLSRGKEKELRQWVETGEARTTVRGDAGHEIGRVLLRGAQHPITATRLRVGLVRDPSMPEGWRIVTSFPDL